MVEFSYDSASFFDLLQPYAPAVELLLKFLALIGGLFGGLPKISNWLKSPKVKFSDYKIEVEEAVYLSPGAVNVEHSKVSWRILNLPKLWFFGKHMINVVTKWNISKEDKPGDWGYSGNEGPVSLIPIGRSWIQGFDKRETFEKGKYILTLTVLSNDDVVGSDVTILEV